LPEVKRKVKKPSEDASKELEQLNIYIDALGEKDVTESYENWLLLAMGISYSLGEDGRACFHKLSKNYPDYDVSECDEKFDGCLEQDMSKIEHPITIATVYQIINNALPKITTRKLAKKYNISHAVGIGEDVQQGDLAGHVRYGLWLYKKIVDKKSSSPLDLRPVKLNLNVFEQVLRTKGFFRYATINNARMYVHVVDNIVEEVDTADILRIVTEYIEQSGNAVFSYQQVEYNFSWEELSHLWREIRAQGNINQQIAASLNHWVPDLLKDEPGASYIPYLNGVVQVTDKGTDLLSYSRIKQHIWRERILPREFKYTPKKGMFEEFFANVTGPDKSSLLRAQWYYGYMLHSTKRQSTARAWLLYDTRSGNNGRSGKTIIGTALGHIRNVTVIDGKQVDLRNRFAWQTVKPYTNILFIDDPAKYITLNPFFNIITGKMYADMKGAKPLELDLKVLFASNYVLEAGGESEKGRQFVTQVNDFYVKWGKAHGDTITPIVDMHGKEFFTDWTTEDWSKFDSFSTRCLQYYFKNNSAPAAEIGGNSAQLRFIQVHEVELFYELCMAFKSNCKQLDSAAGCIVGQQVLTNVIREGNEHVKANKAGKIAREFLDAIGAKNVEIATIRVGGVHKMAYKTSTELKKLDLGMLKEEENEDKVKPTTTPKKRGK
jgi:hypothetical protein